MSDRLIVRRSARAGRAGVLADARWIEVPTRVDERGALSALEAGYDVPFEIRRVYFLHDLAADRGGHAHRSTHQTIVALAGSCEVELRDGHGARTFLLDDPRRALYVVPMLFLAVRRCTPECRVLVLASTHYDPSRTIRTWDEFLAEWRSKP